MPSRAALAKIHIAKKELNISDDNYRELLSGWCIEGTKKPVSSSTELTDRQAEDLLATLKKIGFVAKPSAKRRAQSEKYFRITLPVKRGDEFATQKQMNMLCGLWVSYSREKTAESFRKFVCSIAKIDLPDWLLKTDVQKVIKGIKSLAHSAKGREELK